MLRPTLILSAILLITACGKSPGGRAPDEAIAGPAAGETRKGVSYRVEITGAEGQPLVFQVLEPETLVGGETYPVVLHSHGFGNSRFTEYPPAGTDQAGAVRALTDNQYGVVSIDMRGHGETGGLIRVHDPDGEIQDVVLVVDWLEENIDWATHRFDTDAGEENIVLGSIGASYGGQFQLLFHAVDPGKRLDTMIPSNTWTDLTYALNTNNVLKSGWIALLFGAGNNSGDRFNFDPYVTDILQRALTNNEMPDDGSEFLRYHSFDYFCDQIPVASNGPGLTPMQPAVAPNAMPVLFTQGLRDTLFNFNDAWSNYNCMRDVGSSDVRMITYQAGHNTIFFGPGVAFQPRRPTDFDQICGPLTYNDAMLGWMDEHLKLIPGRANEALGDPNEICLSLDVDTAIWVDRSALKIGGTEFSFDAVPVTTAQQVAVPVATQAFADGAIVAGIPTAEITLESVNPLGTDPIVFIGIGHRRATGNGQGVWDTMDNQVTPVRGVGSFTIDLAGVGEQIGPGDELAILISGSYQTHQASSTRDPLSASMTVSGSVFVPVLNDSEFRLAE